MTNATERKAPPPSTQYSSIFSHAWQLLLRESERKHHMFEITQYEQELK
jgi:hypothetical protein